MKRWVILEHRISKDNIQGRHFDLLLEENDSCRTWRMEQIPVLDGPAVKVISLKPHELYWLDRKESYVSGGRGWAKQVAAGFYSGFLSKNFNDPILLKIDIQSKKASLELCNQFCRIFSI